MVVIRFEPPRRGQPLYKGQKTSIYIVPKVSFVRRFDCSHDLATSGWLVAEWLKHSTASIEDSARITNMLGVNFITFSRVMLAKS